VVCVETHRGTARRQTSSVDILNETSNCHNCGSIGEGEIVSEDSCSCCGRGLKEEEGGEEKRFPLTNL